MTEAVHGFHGRYGFLSNFAMSVVEIDGIVYPSAEHAYQAAKLPVGDRAAIAAMVDPGHVKRFVRESYGDPPGWSERRVDVMLHVVTQKFAQNPRLGEALLVTGDADLVEENDWGDDFWGCVNGAGENQLGRILMDVRSRLLADSG